MLKGNPEKTTCYHCGEDCASDIITEYDKQFCCQGCKTVYQILNKVQLCEYYNINESPGLKQNDTVRRDKFAFLDDKELQLKLIHFKDAKQSHVTLYLPQMHCSSCIWLLEQLRKIDGGIINSQVNFLKKEVTVVYDHNATSLRKIAELLTNIGYEPHFSLSDASEKKIKKYDKARIYKIGITGFCFGNIMLLSFPEYFSLGNMEDVGLKRLFSIINLILALPVFFYGASDFFVSTWKSIKQRFLNIDVPIALAIVITFGRSVYEIISDTGPGYLDSMSGIVFFMLIGRFFQDKTYNTLAFNRDYTSYFPLGITVLNEDGTEKQIPISDLKIGQRIKIHSQEIIPADCILFLGKANIDYSFVSGEAIPIEKNIGEIIYAGGKQLGGALELEVVKDVSQSYLTQLWNNDAFNEPEEKNVSYIHQISKYFTLMLFSIAIITALYWFNHDSSLIWNSVTSILIVACPCALLLSATFTNGNMLRVLQNFGFYARNAGVIEQISGTTDIVFDKTGTITKQQSSTITYTGIELNPLLTQMFRSLSAQSNHPLSRSITHFLPHSKTLLVKQFTEQKGKGISGIVNGVKVMIGSADLVNEKKQISDDSSKVYVKMSNDIVGHFSIRTKYRDGLSKLLSALRTKYDLSLVSGDNDSEYSKLHPLFNSQLLFNRSPQDKLNYVKDLQKKHKKVMMIGDGLNDAGALKQSNVGIAITDNLNNFSPACDVIMDARSFSKLDKLLHYCTKNKLIINISFVVSIIYNVIGLSFAVQGDLAPVIAAILMPLSSISIVLLTTTLSSVFALKLNKTIKEPNIINYDINHISN